MGKSKDKEKKKKKDKDKERSKKDKDVSKEKSRHKSDRKHSPPEHADAHSHHHHGRSPTRSSKKEKREDLKRKRSPDSKDYSDSYKSKRSHIAEEDEPEEGEVRESVPSASDSTTKESDNGVKVSTKGGDISMSIEETNKLRIQLGLKPLDLGKGDSNQPPPPSTNEDSSVVDTATPDTETTQKKEPQHMPPKNIGEIAAADKMREKIKIMRETREIAKKLSTVQGLGEANPSEDVDATSWVNRMRDKEKEKEMALKRAKLLEEMDDEFGISDLMKTEYSHPSLPSTQPSSAPSYTSDHLTGLTIQHKEDHFMEGKDVVLTLKDARILDQENSEDVLVNVNMLNDEHASRNVQLKKGIPSYVPYEEQFDEYGNPKTRSLLYKYDEEIEGVKKESFVLGEKGTFDVGKLEKEKQEAKRIIEQRAIKLELPKAVIASEYYTNEEMVQFKKRKKRRKKEKFKADDLVPLDSKDETKDYGSRRVQEPENENGSLEAGNESMETEPVPDIDIKPDPILLDDQDSTVDSALARTRRLLKGSSTMSERKTGAAFVATMVAAAPRIKQEPTEDDRNLIGQSEGEGLVLNTTAEFCRNIGEDDGQEKYQDNKIQRDTIMEDVDVKEEEEEMEDVSDERRGVWTEVDPTDESDKTKKGADDVDVLELDVVMSTGVAAALQMASKKGFIDGENSKGKQRDGSTKTIVEGHAVRDWEYERDKGKDKDREREHIRDMPFAEKSGYKPDVNIEYVDNMGRLMTPKEAFRHMSHKFHGKMSGKKKNEKRTKRLQDEFLLHQASTVDTPLQTVELFRKRQENSQSPYVVLSGAQQQHALNMTELTKRK